MSALSGIELRRRALNCRSEKRLRLSASFDAKGAGAVRQFDCLGGLADA